MKTALLGMCFLLAAAGPDIQSQRRGARSTATLAIQVSDPAGAPVSNVKVTVDGPEQRTVRTEGNRIALENLPAGSYRLRFEREGFTTLERELTARGGAPTEVKVTLTPAPAPAPPPAPTPVEPPRPAVDAKPARLDLLAVIEKEFLGRGAGKTTPLTCGAGGTAALIQLNDPIAQHSHADADEFIYVIAGEGSANVQGTPQRLRAGVLVFVPRGVPHSLSHSGRNPLIVMSTQAGEPCGAGQAGVSPEGKRPA